MMNSPHPDMSAPAALPGTAATEPIPSTSEIPPHHLAAIAAAMTELLGPGFMINGLRRLDRHPEVVGPSPWQRTARKEAMEAHDPRPRRGWRA